MNRPAPTLVFDVNETLLDLAALGPVFHSVLGEEALTKEWFALTRRLRTMLPTTGTFPAP